MAQKSFYPPLFIISPSPSRVTFYGGDSDKREKNPSQVAGGEGGREMFMAAFQHYFRKLEGYLGVGRLLRNWFPMRYKKGSDKNVFFFFHQVLAAVKDEDDSQNPPLFPPAAPSPAEQPLKASAAKAPAAEAKSDAAHQKLFPFFSAAGAAGGSGESMAAAFVSPPHRL